MIEKSIKSCKNYFLDRSDRYNYIKHENKRLKQEITKLENSLKYLNNEMEFLNDEIENKSSINIQLKQEITRLNNNIDSLSCNLGNIPPGHFYSPINDIDFLKKREEIIWNYHLIDGINLNLEEQLHLFTAVNRYHSEMPFKKQKQPDLRYYFYNGWFGEMDGTILYSMIRTLKPKKIVEVGSGFTSALMMDVNNIFFKNKIKLTFIEPNPERLYSLMVEEDKNNNEIIPRIVQDVDLKKFKELKQNDILFIDSSHVVKTGSDVQHILFKILPILNSGVYIHFHDILYPKEYPKDWIFHNRRDWNEQYFLIAFLMYNDQFKIVLAPNYLYKHDHTLFNFVNDHKRYVGGSFWFKKI